MRNVGWSFLLVLVLMSCSDEAELQGAAAVLPAYLQGDSADCGGSVLQEGRNTGFVSAGQSREVLIALPEPVFGGPRPTLVAFNGTGESGPEFFNRANLQDFVDKGFIVIAPSSNANGKIWPVWDAQRTVANQEEENPDLIFFDQLLSCAAPTLPIDAKRLYVAGHSAGGIMANFLLQRRSEMLAGGIVASGIFAATEPLPAAEEPEMLDDLFVIVTWGGQDDRYTGETEGVSSGAVDFVGEASVASEFYNSQDNVGEINCSVDDGSSLSGHIWLPINEYFIERLLAHPKGISGKEEYGIDGQAEAPSPAVSDISCRNGAFEYVASDQVVCEESTTSHCQETCQLLGDCAVENALVSGTLGSELMEMGFDGTDCGGCITKCEEVSVKSEDADVLSCLAGVGDTAMCPPSGTPTDFVTGFNGCCAGKTDSGFCDAFCSAVDGGIGASFFEAGCQ